MDEYLWTCFFSLLTSFAFVLCALHHKPVETLPLYQMLDDTPAKSRCGFMLVAVSAVHNVRMYLHCAALFFLLSGLGILFHFTVPTQVDMRLVSATPEAINVTAGANVSF